MKHTEADPSAMVGPKFLAADRCYPDNPVKSERLKKMISQMRSDIQRRMEAAATQMAKKK